MLRIDTILKLQGYKTTVVNEYKIPEENEIPALIIIM